MKTRSVPTWPRSLLLLTSKAIPGCPLSRRTCKPPSLPAPRHPSAAATTSHRQDAVRQPRPRRRFGRRRCGSGRPDGQHPWCVPLPSRLLRQGCPRDFRFRNHPLTNIRVAHSFGCPMPTRPAQRAWCHPFSRLAAEPDERCSGPEVRRLTTSPSFRVGRPAPPRSSPSRRRPALLTRGTLTSPRMFTRQSSSIKSRLTVFSLIARSGTSITVQIRDNTGTINYSDKTTIQAGTSTSCSASSGSTTAAAAGAG